MRERRKFILILCEGPTDELALYPVMKSFFHPAQIRFHICHGDPLISYSENGPDPMNEIKRIMHQEMKKYGLRENDIAAVFELTDTDGAFIADEKITYDETCHRIDYRHDGISTAFPESILTRNRRKKMNTDKLISKTCITDKIPYRLYFVSRNIEEGLYGHEERMNDNRKKYLADDFADEFGSDWRHFYNYIVNECGVFDGGYEESWRMIKSGTESLCRHTNLNTLFEDFSYLSDNR